MPHESFVYRETEAEAEKEIILARAVVMSTVGGEQRRVS
jgi:hypothetical protein